MSYSYSFCKKEFGHFGITLHQVVCREKSKDNSIACSGYNFFGYWQEATHSRECPWFSIGSERERNLRLREVIEKPVQENKLLDVMKRGF